MNIRLYDHKDYPEILNLLSACGVEPPVEASDLSGVCLVSEEDGKVIGCVWALTGASTQAHIDYFAVDKDYREKHVGWLLIMAMDSVLKKLGVKRYTFFIEPDNEYFNGIMTRFGEANNVKRLRDLRFYRREITG